VRVAANGLTFEALSVGDGPRLALLLHGFPDDAGSMRPLAERLAAHGFTAVAPFMRGYGATGPAPDGRYGASALAADVLALVAALGRRRALVVGHDWGAVAGYAAAVRDPDVVARLVAISVPPPRVLLRNLPRHPAQLGRSAYMARFQVPWVAERGLRRDGMAEVDRLWARWSPGFIPPAGRLEAVKASLGAPGALEAALGYYRALRRPSREDLGLLLGRVPAPTLVVAGARDGCIAPEVYEDLDDGFVAPRRLVVVPWAGHFVPLEATDELARVTLEHAGRA
jgi:pimeloyl-ACP methyl ester carboxylesterase